MLTVKTSVKKQGIELIYAICSTHINTIVISGCQNSDVFYFLLHLLSIISRFFYKKKIHYLIIRKLKEWKFSKGLIKGLAGSLKGRLVWMYPRNYGSVLLLFLEFSRLSVMVSLWWTQRRFARKGIKLLGMKRVLKEWGKYETSQAHQPESHTQVSSLLLWINPMWASYVHYFPIETNKIF